MKAVHVIMPYIGNCLSVNHYHIGKTYHIKPETKQWMGVLTYLVRHEFERGKLTPRLPVRIIIKCFFKDRRNACDPANLHKVIGDAVAAALKLNDKDFLFEDEPTEYNKELEANISIAIPVATEEMEIKWTQK